MGDLFKKEAFDQVAITFIPGSVATLPYAFVLWAYFPEMATAWKNNTVTLTLVAVVGPLTAGLIIESLGGWVESHVWDRVIRKFVDPSHLKQWDKYLKLRMDTEPIGQRYLRTKVMAMKFELGLAIALPIGWAGFAWFRTLKPVIASCPFLYLTSLPLALFVYLLWDSYQTAKILAKVRQLIIEAAEGEASTG